MSDLIWLVKFGKSIYQQFMIVIHTDYVNLKDKKDQNVFCVQCLKPDLFPNCRIEGNISIYIC